MRTSCETQLCNRLVSVCTSRQDLTEAKTTLSLKHCQGSKQASRKDMTGILVSLDNSNFPWELSEITASRQAPHKQAISAHAYAPPPTTHTATPSRALLPIMVVTEPP